ncbi:uncharacterized protein ISCGN_013595 [Ixodes scapularis]
MRSVPLTGTDAEGTRVRRVAEPSSGGPSDGGSVRTAIENRARAHVAVRQSSRASLTHHLVCRYCGLDSHPEQMVAPCRCRKRSTLRWAHISCLESYMNREHSSRCHFCKKHISSAVRKMSVLDWLTARSARRYQCGLLFAVLLTVSMVPALYMAWAYAMFTVASQLHWAVTVVVVPFMLFQTSTWLGFAAYSFWIYYSSMRTWRQENAVFTFSARQGIPRSGEHSPER